MIKRSERDLQIVRTRQGLPSVECDVDGFPAAVRGYGEVLAYVLGDLSARSDNLKATIYVHQGPSVNFGVQTWSAFFGVAGDEKILDSLLAGIQRAGVKRARFSDQIDPKSSIREFHVEDGRLWRPLEAGFWYAEESPDAAASDFPSDSNDGEDDATPESDEDEEDSRITRTSRPTRFRAARWDATIGTISKRIEEVFGLPEGSVALCGRNQKPLRRDELIATLRKRWGDV